MMRRENRSIVWFRLDLRLLDNPALAQAARGGEIVPVYIWSPGEEGDWPPGAASRWWLHGSLCALVASLKQKGLDLIIRHGPAARALTELAAETGSAQVCCSRRFEPAARRQEQHVAAALARLGIGFEILNASVFIEPHRFSNRKGDPYEVFTPFWHAARRENPGEPDLNRLKLAGPAQSVQSLLLEDLQLLPKVDWEAGLRAAWTPGEAGAWDLLKQFLDLRVSEYRSSRDLPARAGTSQLSPHLHFGEISPRALLAALTHAAPGEGSDAAIRQLYWREFAYHLLYHFPHMPNEPLRPDFKKFPWRRSPQDLLAWQRGKTGFPIVDAAMRELWHTGWMHNRARMIVGSFLVKDLLIDWREGAKWFWDTLVDADLANNTVGWQWIAGCGADAAPYFRVFNPDLQAKKFDPNGDYMRRWVPQAFEGGKDYPSPIVDHGAARERALEAFTSIKRPEKLIR